MNLHALPGICWLLNFIEKRVLWSNETAILSCLGVKLTLRIMEEDVEKKGKTTISIVIIMLLLHLHNYCINICLILLAFTSPFLVFVLKVIP